MDRRIFGLETEYGVTCAADDGRGLSADEVARINRYHTEYLNGEDKPFSSPLFGTRTLLRAD